MRGRRDPWWEKNPSNHAEFILIIVDITAKTVVVGYILFEHRLVKLSGMSNRTPCEMYYLSINQTPIGPITDTSTGDDERPKCGRCRRLGKPCIRATGPRWKFRHQTSGNPSVTRESPSAEGTQWPSTYRDAF